jgi:hypothetical protein
MSQTQNVSFTLEEVYKILCPKCRKHFRSLIRDRQDRQLDAQLLKK